MRRRRAIRRKILPDSVYRDKRVQKFINCLMHRGKKGIAEHVFYGSMNIIQSKLKVDPVELFRQALDNVRPVLEVKSRRIGGATYQVPLQVPEYRSYALATRWILANAKARKGKSMIEKLAAEFIDASKKEGGAIKKREDTYKMAEANKAFAHYR